MNHGYEEHLAGNFYFDKTFNAEAAKILPGEYFVTEKNMLLVTVLGSCVAACIRDTRTGIGGMNHFMLPDGGSKDMLGSSARYGTYAMEVLINHLLKMGASRSRLEAKIFGGGAVMETLKSSNVGTRNVEFVIDFLKTERIPIVAKDLLETYPRKVYYFPNTGKVLLKKMHKVRNDTLYTREREYQNRLGTSQVSGDIELFT